MDVAKGKEVYGPSRDPKFASSIVEYLDEPRDVVSFSLVCKTFLHIAIKKIWTKPGLSSRTSFDSFLSTLSSPHHTVPYTSFITTINLNAFPDITDDQFRLLGACENLAHLDMRMCQNISAATLQHTFSQFHRLKGVDLEGISSITDDVMLSLARNNPHLRGVKLGKCSPGHWVLSDAGVIALGDYCGDSLREVYLHLPSLSLVTSVALRCLITRCPRLQTLDIAHGRSVDDGVVRLVWQSVGQTLRKLNLAGCSELTDVMLPPPAPSVHDTHPRDPAVRPLPPIPKAPRLLAPSLREIDLTDCKRLTDYAIELICTNAPKLRNLNLKGCRQLTDASLYSVAKLGSSLQQLNVAKLSEITDKGVNAISEGCRKLANIDLSECSKLTNSCVVSLSRLSRIESLRLNRNENITDVGVMSLATPGISSSLKRIHLSFCTNVTAFSVHHLLSVHRQITFVSVSGIPDFLGDPALLKLSKPVDRGWKPETFRVYATPGSIAKLRKVLSKRKSAPNANTGGIVSGLEAAIPPTSACAQPATSSPESGPAFALLAAKLEHIQRPVSPVQPELGSRPKDAIVCAGLGTGSVTRQTAAAPDMNSEKVSPEASKRSHRSRKGRTEKGTMTLVTSPEPPPLESSAGAGIKPQSRSPPSQPQPSPVPSYPPPPPPPLAQPQARAQAPLPSSKLLENSPISIETSPLRQGPQVNGAAQVHPLLIQKKASITIAGAETAAATGLVIEGKGGASDHHHLSGSISSFEDLEDEGSEYDFLDNKSDLESIAASVELGSGTESGHEDDDDDIVNIGHGQAAARPTLGNTLPTTGNERRESGGKGEDGVKSGVFSDDEEDFECVEMPEV